MNSYIIHDADGNIISCGLSETQIDQRISTDHTQVWIDFPANIENYRFDIESNSIIAKSQAVIDAKETAEAWDMLRSTRDGMLSASDWTQSPDSPLSDAKKSEWATYRQQLRDLPSTTTDPSSPSWPQKPD